MINRKTRIRIKWPQLHLYDTTGLSKDVQQGLRIAILAVTMSVVFTNVTTGAAWTGYLRALGADAMTLGILSAIPVAASTLQIFASFILERRRARRGLFICFGLISRFAWIVIGLIPLLIPLSAQGLRLISLMVLLAVSSGAASFLNVSFYSLMGDMVPLRIRGRYFSARQAISLIAGILAGLIVSHLIDSIQGIHGYMIVIAIAGIFGALDILCFLFVKWPPMEKPEGKPEGIFSMLRSVLHDRNYMKIVGYFTLWFFAVNISAPFGNVYFLEHLKMTFTEITLYNQIIPNVATVLIISWWGRKADQYGNQPIVQTAGLYCMLLVFCYLFTGPRSFAILPFAHILSGMSWPASDLGQQNMYLAKAPAQNRSMYIAVFFACSQLLGTALSNFIGGVLMSGPLYTLEALNLSWFGFEMTRFHFLFIISGTLRCICVLGFLPHLRQPSDTKATVMIREIALHSKGRMRAIWYGLRAKRQRVRYRKKNMENTETIETREEDI